MKSQFSLLVFLSVAVLSLLNSCYYDNMEDINPKADTTATSTCDTANISYSKHIAPIMQAQCVSGCHSAGNRSGGYALDSYDAVKSCAATGKLYGSVVWDGSASQMPKNGNKITDCKISQIKKWIAAGYPQ